MAARDRLGFRPLVMGKQDNAHYFSSETCSFDLLDVTYEREVKPGEMLTVHRSGEVSSDFFGQESRKSNCIFEHIYFARPDSYVFEQSAYQVRKQLGRALAKQFPVDADFVVPVPDSGNFAAMGYAQESGIDFEMAFIRNHYIGRTFIEPKQSIRSFGVKIKLNPVKELLRDKKVVIIDDSIVRGTTSKKIIKMLRDAKVKEITMLISSPRFISPCYYGVDTPNEEELIASKMSDEEIASYIDADRIGYLSLENMYASVKQDANEFCDACFTKNYPNNLLPHASRM
jgi:amidophosphoribosyltransferase